MKCQIKRETMPYFLSDRVSVGIAPRSLFFRRLIRASVLRQVIWISIGIWSLFTVRNLGCRSVRFRSATFQISTNPRSSCLIVASPRGINEAKETAGMNGFFLSKQCVFFFRDKPLIETIATNLMTSDPCQLKLTIEGSERSSKDDLGAIDTDLKPIQLSHLYMQAHHPFRHLLAHCETF